METMDMKSLLEKILLVAKFQGYKTITVDNWADIQEYYDLKVSWNEVLEAKTILTDPKKLSNFFQPVLAREIYQFCDISKNTSKTDTRKQTLSADLTMGHAAENSKHQSSIEPVKPGQGQFSSVEPFTSTNNSGSLVKLSLRCDMQSSEIFKKQTPTLQGNLMPASSNRFENLQTIRSLTNTQWVIFLEYAKRNRMLPYLLGIEFWDRLISGVQSKIPINKSAKELRIEFITTVLPNRESFPKNIIPKLKLRPSDCESLFVIFFEIKKFSSVTTSIQNLIHDGVLSDILDWEGWVHVFIDALFLKDDSYWMETPINTKSVKELLVHYFFENVALKLLSNNDLKFQNMINSAIDEIAFSFNEQKVN